MRPLSSEDAVDQIKSRLNLVDVVQQHVRLRKEGREFKGLCPFHQEKTPSFHVSEPKQSWYCFGCDKGGDLFAFVEQIEKVDFPGALRILAEQAGVELPERSGAAQERSQLRRRLVDLNRLAAKYYEYVLHSMEAGEPGRELLGRREVDEETVRRFGLGYAPGGASLVTFLRKRGHDVRHARAAGLARDNGTDFFQRRLMVPIRDERGTPIAFTGRAVADDDPRKYVNTPETPVYTKARVLFGLDLARPAIQDRGHAVLMEGQFDVIIGHQLGVQNAIASSGTALTGEQLALLRRFTDEVVLMFDNDRAGRAAAGKAVVLAQDHHVRTRVARLTGDAKDPDEFLRHGGRWEDVLRESMPGWEVMVRDAIEGLNSHSPADREVGVRRIREVLALIRDPAQRDTYAEVAGRLFDIEPRLLLAFEAPAPRRPGAARPAAEAVLEEHAPGLPPVVTGKKLSNSVDYLLQVLAVRPEALGRVLGILDPSDLEDSDRAAYERMARALGSGGLEGLERELGEFPPEVQSLVRRAWASSPPPASQDEVVDDLVRRIRRQARRRRIVAIADGLSSAERRGDRAQVEALQAQLKELGERS